MSQYKYLVAKNIVGSDNDLESFLSTYGGLIDKIVCHMPRGMSSIGAAVANCAIKYDYDRALKFIENSKNGIFEGKEDPVYHFYMWLHGIKGPKRKKHDVSTYEVTMYACKQYCLGKKVRRLDRIKETLNWNQSKKKQSSKLIKSS